MLHPLWDKLRVSEWCSQDLPLCFTPDVHYFLSQSPGYLYLHNEPMIPGDFFFPHWVGEAFRAVRDCQHLLAGDKNSLIAVYTYTYMHTLCILQRVMKTLGLITMSSSTVYHTDSPLKLEQSNFLEVRKHLYQFHLVHPKDGAPSISHTWQALAVFCLNENELNCMFYLCFTGLWNLKGAGSPQILLPCQW